MENCPNGFIQQADGSSPGSPTKKTSVDGSVKCVQETIFSRTDWNTGNLAVGYFCFARSDLGRGIYLPCTLPKSCPIDAYKAVKTEIIVESLK